MPTVGKLKKNPDDENEIRDVRRFRDAGRCHVTPLVTFPPDVALAVVNSLSNVVRRAHTSKAALTPDDDAIVRAQTFEEGDVYMLASPFDGYFAKPLDIVSLLAYLCDLKDNGPLGDGRLPGGRADQGRA